MSGSPGSTVPRRQLGRYLRQYREAAGKTIRDAYIHIECSHQKIWRLETGDTDVVVRSTDIESLCRFYDVPDDMATVMLALAKATKDPGWWQPYGDSIPKWFEAYVSLEGAARRLRKYEPSVVPGLLQAQAYSEHVVRAERPAPAEADVEPRVIVKRERQRMLHRTMPPPPQVEVILAEAVLWAELDTPGAMQQQLHHLLMANDQPHISVRVLPKTIGPHAASISGSFTIMEFPTDDATGRGEPPTVYNESLTGALYLDRPRELHVYEQVWTSLADIALSEADSSELITAIMKSQGERP